MADVEDPFTERARVLLESLGLPASAGCMLAVLVSERPEGVRQAMAQRTPTRESMVARLRGELLDTDPDQFVDDFFRALPDWPSITRIRGAERT